jgi:hypothetical protein
MRNRCEEATLFNFFGFVNIYRAKSIAVKKFSSTGDIYHG